MKSQLINARLIFCLVALCSAGLANAHTKKVIEADTTAIRVPVGGNAWVSKGAKAEVTMAGIMNWNSGNDTISVWVRAENTGPLHISGYLRVPQGVSTIEVVLNNKTLKKRISNDSFAAIDLGTVSITQPGYVCIRLKGIERTGPIFAELTDVVLQGDAAVGALYVKNNEGNYFYWGRRGPSVHLSYQVPAAIKQKVEWFYNEVTVPVGEDKQGSYFISNGFSVGYFGMQVNSPTERHVLFSVWSPFETNDPKSIPDSLKIQMLKKGANVHAGEFGSEGSGGQSYMNYMWKAGKTYCFLTHAQPDAAKNTTTFTCYFKAADETNWQLMASFKRPQTNSYLTGLHSFLENFDPDYGYSQRKGNYGNGWVVDIDGNWTELTDAMFTVDATANIKYRMDYSGGIENGMFFLRNCGFFNDLTPPKTILHRQPGAKTHPVINFNTLP
jgi:hypothetical protein